MNSLEHKKATNQGKRKHCKRCKHTHFNPMNQHTCALMAHDKVYRTSWALWSYRIFTCFFFKLEPKQGFAGFALLSNFVGLVSTGINERFQCLGRSKCKSSWKVHDSTFVPWVRHNHLSEQKSSARQHVNQNLRKRHGGDGFMVSNWIVCFRRGSCCVERLPRITPKATPLFSRKNW